MSSKPKTIYRYSFLGEAFIEAINEVREKVIFDDEFVEELLREFDVVGLLLTED